MPVCPGGSQPREWAPTATAIVGEGAALLIGRYVPWLGVAAGLATPMFLDIAPFCSAEPPELPEWTAGDFIALLGGGWSAEYLTAHAKLMATLRHYAWYTFCECTTGGELTPPALPAPTGTPTVNPVTRSPAGGGRYAEEVLADNPAIYWRFNERGGLVVHNQAGGNQRALLGRGNGNTLPTLAYSGPVSDGGSTLLSGAVWQGADIFPMFTGAVTLELWAWAPGRSLQGIPGPTVQMTSDGGAFLEWWGGGQFPNFRRGATALIGPALTAVSSWRHYVLVHTGSAMTMYTNGVQSDTAADAFAGQVLPFVSIGNNSDSVFLAELAIYPGALSEARILAHFNAADQAARAPVWQGLDTAPISGLGTSATIPSEMVELVTLIQRQAVPFAYIEGPSFGGLVGDGELDVQGVLAIAVQLNAIPAGMGTSEGTPLLVWEAGRVAFGTDDGYLPWQRLTSIETFLRTEGFVTKVGYTLGPGVVATVRTFVREP